MTFTPSEKINEAICKNFEPTYSSKICKRCMPVFSNLFAPALHLETFLRFPEYVHRIEDITLVFIRF